MTVKVHALLLLIFSWIPIIQAATTSRSNTLYSLSKEKIYVKLTNNELVSLNFSITGDSTPTQVYSLKSPPDHADLFLVNDELYGMKAEGDDDEMALIKYNESDDDWTQVKLDLDGLDNKQFLQGSNYLTSPANDNNVYIYGGVNNKDVITNRLISIDFDQFKVSNISTSTKPQSFYGAANLLAPDPYTQLLVGGHSNSGWLNMYQLATWDFQSGWSFQQIDKNVTTLGDNDEDEVQINSRKYAQVLPIFGKLDSTNILDISNNFQVSKALIIGGELDGNPSDPQLIYLNLNTNSWNYQVPNNTNGFDINDHLGIVTIFDNIITIGDKKSNKRDDNSYDLNYFDLKFNKVEKLTIPKLSQEKSQDDKDMKESIQQKAILGTVIPVSAIIIMVTAGYFLMKKRKKNLMQQELSELNNHFDHYFNEKEKFDTFGNDNTSHRSKLLYSDSHSTLDVNSIDSWVRKREEYDQQQKFMQSQETLYQPTSQETNEMPEHLTANSPIAPKPLKTRDKLNKSVVRLKKSISFNSLPSPDRRPRSNLLLDDDDNESHISPYTPADLEEYSDEHEGSDVSNHELYSNMRTLDPRTNQQQDCSDSNSNQSDSNSQSHSNSQPHQPQLEAPPQDEPQLTAINQRSTNDVSDYESVNSIPDLDVQVLVSSKRRSVLRIMNPDDDETVRKRVPSNEMEE